MTTNQKTKIQTIVHYYSPLHQKQKAIEEFIELIEVIIKDITKDNCQKTELLSEIADASVMLEELKLIYGLNQKDVTKEINSKLNRQIDRISKL